MVIELVGFGQSLHAFEISYHKHVLGLMESMHTLIVAIAVLSCVIVIKIVKFLSTLLYKDLQMANIEAM